MRWLNPARVVGDHTSRLAGWRRAVVYGLALLALYGVWCALLYALQTTLIFPGHLVPRAGPPVGLGEVWWRELPEGRVLAWWRPVADGPRPTVIYAHGNAESVTEQEGIVQGYHDLGWSVLLLEYRGYGPCGGQPSEAALTADAVWFHDRLREDPRVEPTRLVYHGRSLGGGVVAQLAARRPPRAMILESTFRSVARLTRRYGVPAVALRSPFRTDRLAPDFGWPVLLIHGTRDTLIPITHARGLARLLPAATLLELPRGHNDLPGDELAEEYWSAIGAWLPGE